MFAERLLRFLNCKEWITPRRMDSIVTWNRSYCNVNSEYYTTLNKKKILIHNNIINVPNENLHARSILDRSEAYSRCLATPLPKKELENLKIDEINYLIKKSWLNMKNNEIIKNFELLSYYNSDSNQFLESIQCSGMLKVITNRLSTLSDSELQHLLKCLELWKLSDYKSNLSYITFCKSVDNECAKRISNWSIDEILLMNDLWLKSKCFRNSNFVTKSLTNIDYYKMTPANLVHYAYLLKINNKMLLDLSNFELCLEKCINQFSVEELGIISMAFFKYQTYTVKSKHILMVLIDKLKKNMDNVSDISLAAICKFLRNSIDLQTVQLYDSLQNAFISRIPHCAVKTLTHIAHMEARTLLHNRELTSKILERYKNEIKNARLKDIERILFTLYIFNYDPKTTDFYDAAYEELLKPDRVTEINRFPKSLLYCVLYMLQANYYPEKILNHIMDQKFLNHSCQNNIQELDREYLILDYCIELEHPEYLGPRLRHDIRMLLLKRYGVLKSTPLSESNKVKQSSKLMIHAVDSLKKFLGSESLVHVDSVLPHFDRTDIILCYDPRKRKFLSVSNRLSKIPFGSIKSAPKDGKKWYAFSIVSHNKLTRNTQELTGAFIVQLRHLEKIGYTPIIIPHFKWHALLDDRMRNSYLKKLFQTLILSENKNVALSEFSSNFKMCI